VRGMWHILETGEKRKGLRGGGGVRERDHLADLGVDGRTIIKWIFKKWDGGGGIGLD